MRQGDNVALLSSSDTQNLCKTVSRVYLSFLIFEYFPLINEASYLFCDSRSYIFQHLNNSHFTWPVKGNAIWIWSNFKQPIVENFSSVPSFRDV